MGEIEIGVLGNRGWWLSDDSPERLPDGDFSLPVWGESEDGEEVVVAYLITDCNPQQ